MYAPKIEPGSRPVARNGAALPRPPLPPQDLGEARDHTQHHAEATADSPSILNTMNTLNTLNTLNTMNANTNDHGNKGDSGEREGGVGGV